MLTQKIPLQNKENKVEQYIQAIIYIYFYSYKFSFNFLLKKSMPGVLDLFVASFGNAMPFAFFTEIDLMLMTSLLYTSSPYV